MHSSTTIEWFEGSRETLAELFALADDSPAAVNAYRDLGRVLVARDGATIIGHLQIVAGDRADQAEVKSLAVREDRQGVGVGRLLVEHAAAAGREERDQQQRSDVTPSVSEGPGRAGGARDRHSARLPAGQVPR